MPIDATRLRSLVERELEQLSDARVLANIRRLLVAPRPILRDWNYGKPGEQYPCWEILNDDPSNSGTGIVYCESGFGPERPWGLVWLSGDNLSMGDDSGWFSTFLDAYFDCFAPTVLPIWRVVKHNSSGNPIPLTDEGDWDERWEQVATFKKADPNSSFYVHHTIPYGSKTA